MNSPLQVASGGGGGGFAGFGYRSSLFVIYEAGRSNAIPVGANSFAWHCGCRLRRCGDRRDGEHSAEPTAFVAAYSVADGPCNGE
jgi:hypothetical protein